MEERLKYHSDHRETQLRQSYREGHLNLNDHHRSCWCQTDVSSSEGRGDSAEGGAREIQKHDVDHWTPAVAERIA